LFDFPSTGSRFDSRSGDRLSRRFVILLGPSRKISGKYLKVSVVK
jgi:hypothetical protein